MRQPYPNELWHYQVPGAKHGVRRYQYKDGSYTPLGRIHYGIGKESNGRSDHTERLKGRETYSNHFSNPKSIYRGQFAYGYYPGEARKQVAANGSTMITGVTVGASYDDSEDRTKENAKKEIARYFQNNYKKMTSAETKKKKTIGQKAVEWLVGLFKRK